MATLTLIAVSATAVARAETPPLDVTGMTFVSSREEVTELVLRAATARFRPDADVADLDAVEATVSTAQSGPGFEIRCNEGTLNLKSNNFYAHGDVRGKTEGGREFTSDWVRYDHADGLLFTDAPVVITESGITFRGGGFRYYVQEQRFRLLGGATVVQDP